MVTGIPGSSTVVAVPNQLPGGPTVMSKAITSRLGTGVEYAIVYDRRSSRS